MQQQSSSWDPQHAGDIQELEKVQCSRAARWALAKWLYMDDIVTIYGTYSYYMDNIVVLHWCWNTYRMGLLSKEDTNIYYLQFYTTWHSTPLSRPNKTYQAELPFTFHYTNLLHFIIPNSATVAYINRDFTQEQLYYIYLLIFSELPVCPVIINDIKKWGLQQI